MKQARIAPVKAGPGCRAAAHKDAVGLAVAGCFLLAATDLSRAAEASPVEKDKSVYSLFNPVPEDLVRELNPDRPDETETPITVDAGHFQLEMDFASFTGRDRSGSSTRVWNVAPFNIKAGLLNNVDFQLVFDNYVNARNHDGATGATTTQSGTGDLTTRLKVNLWGDDGGKTSFAVLPYVKCPTSTGHVGNNAVEGGVILPLAIKLPGDFDLGCETAAGWWRNDADSGFHEEYINSVTVDHALAGKLSGYLEFFSNISTEHHSGWIGTIDFGLEYLAAKNVQFDLGCNFGVTRAADDYHPFVGITVRF